MRTDGGVGVSSAASPRLPPPLFSKWELEGMAQLETLHTRDSQRPLLLGLGSMLALLFIALLLVNSLPLPAFVLIGGGALMLVLLGVALHNLTLHFSASPPAEQHLTQRQRALLGLPLVPSAHERNERGGAITATPTASPRTPSTATTTPLHRRPRGGVATTERTPIRSPSPFFRREGPRTFGSPRFPLTPSSPMTPSPLASPGRTGERPITDERALNAYLEGLSRQTTPASPIPSPSTGSFRLAPYRASPQNSPATARTEDFGYLNTQAAEELLDRLNISTLQLDDWAENMRGWLVQHVLKPLVKAMSSVNEAGLPLLKPLMNDTPAPSLTSSTASTNMWYSMAPPQPTMNDVMSRYSQNPVVQMRFQLEHYMNVLGCSSREYLIQRIKELAKGGCMAAFQWNGGGTWKDKEWTPELPTDSQIVIHLFCTFMDLSLPVDPRTASGKPFTSRHFVVFPDSPESLKSILKIYQPHIHPPHFCLVYKNNTWHTFQGRNNLFHTLVLFIWCAQNKMGGYLGSIPLKHLSLHKVLSSST